MTFKNGMRPVHPGEVLREEYLAPLGMSVYALAGGKETSAHGQFESLAPVPGAALGAVWDSCFA
jgi:hypothetical protein